MSQPEHLPYGGQSAQDKLAFEQYKLNLRRGKSLIQLKSIAQQITPFVRASWSPRSFTPVSTPEGTFDAVVCNISYHYMKHGNSFGDITVMTNKALQYFATNRHTARPNKDGLLQLPNGSLFEPDGRIVTFFI
jgi:hypothetical protein